MAESPTTGIPSTPRAKAGRSLNALLKFTPPYVKNRARDEHIIIKKLSYTFTKGGARACNAILVNMTTTAPDVHEVTVIGLDKKAGPSASRMEKMQIPRLFQQKHLQVDCDCLVGSTNVLTTEGWKTMRELAQPYQPNVFNVDYLVNGKKRKGSAPFFKGRVPVWKLTLSNGRTLTTTPDHELLVYAAEGNLWRKAKDVQVTDKLVANFSENSKPLSEIEHLEGYFLGVMMGDGSMFKPGLPDLKLYGDKAIEILPKLIELGVVDNITIGKPSKNTDCTQVIFSHRAKEILARQKFVNKVDVLLDTESRFLGFMEGLIDVDGTVGKNGISIRGNEFLRKLSLIVSQYGYPPAKVFVEQLKGAKTNLGERQNDLVTFICNRRLTKTLAELITLRPSKQQQLEFSLNKQSYSTKPAVCEVLDKSYAGQQDVYDIVVPGVNRFVAEGVIVHNCGFFCFYCEYALWTWGAAKIKRCNGDPAVVKNPGNIPLVCKHLVVLLKELAEKRF